MKAIERLFQYLDFKGIKHTRAEKDFGLSNGYLNTQLRRNADLGEGAIIKIIDNCPDLNVEWWITGLGNMLKESTKEIKVNSVIHLRTDKKRSIQQVPLYDIVATAGIVELLGESNKKKFIPIDYITIPNLPKCDGALPITGDSMYPLLKSGDIALYKEVHDFENIIWGEMYLVALSHNGDDFFFAKYIQKSDIQGYVKLVSYNQNHQSMDFPINSIQGLALIKASVRINTQF